MLEEKIQLVELVAVLVNLQDFLRLLDQVDLRLKVKNILKSRQSEVRVGPAVPKRMRSSQPGPQVGLYRDLLPTMKPYFVLWKLSIVKDIVQKIDAVAVCRRVLDWRGS